MSGRHYRSAALMLLISILIGTLTVLYGSFGRLRPPDIDVIWRQVDIIRNQLAEKQITLGEGQNAESTFLRYEVTLTRLKNEDASTEKYLLRFRPKYDILQSTNWKPVAWDLALLAHTGDGNRRRVHLVAAKQLKDD